MSHWSSIPYSEKGDLRGFAAVAFYCFGLFVGVFVFWDVVEPAFKSQWTGYADDYLQYYRPIPAKAWQLTDWCGRNVFFSLLPLVVLSVVWFPIQKSLRHTTARIYHKLIATLLTFIVMLWLVMVTQLLFGRLG